MHLGRSHALGSRDQTTPNKPTSQEQLREHLLSWPRFYNGFRCGASPGKSRSDGFFGAVLESK